ncbi:MULTISPECIES: folylpolyglutamate synthase/dihydrofolate synthase family protein [unclassified Granulicatella]|uniref:bifunctional folylpolyglutamate synthase/dihydrofolate synthase n=1 Tax=unclassified Granulicatella TaxID=2630493 RepID=UPI001073AF20|nr:MULTISPECIES: folylpolyglutamate synthase/dihydrofolate synthase family protein [unclassified Granulicatella]MBF0779723.1 bifunctional folylpolyglutamate synthase/dihydrofolate synthase [Granulicatella sp. 19428wC4_WM01]TFU96243.1 bifunctional folylpolyglutamate synthase/dihydrofolate synthase [Granulicatella sp. WM01]
MIDYYKQALDWLYAQPTGKSNPDLSYVKAVLKELGSPHLKVPVIHVTGTNGKGSTIAFLSHILKEHGLNVATFTSPHLLTFNERFQINHCMISDEEIVTYLNQLKKYQLTQFELFTCLFFLYIATHQPDIALVEVGIGGLFDTTNVVQPELSIITSVGIDHLGMLGNSIEDIARQKAGIIKEHVPVFISLVPENCLAIFKEVATQKKSPIHLYPYQSVINKYQLLPNGFTFEFDGNTFQTSIVGKHQLFNVTLALAAAKHYLNEGFNVELAKQGILHTHWSGRMEKVYEKPMIYIDGAHNEQGIHALIDTIQEKFPTQKIKIIFGALSRKDYSSMLSLLAKTFDTYVTTFEYNQSASLEELNQISPHVVPIENWKSAIQLDIAHQLDTVIIFTGSLYFISEVKTYFNQL